MNDSTVLQVSNLTVRAKTNAGTVTLIEDVQFELERGKILGLVGESGCGKTVTSLSMLQLLDDKAIHSEGSMKLNGIELMGTKESVIRNIRGKEIAFIMQNPMNAFTPVFTIGHQFVETIRTHTACTKQQATEIAIDAMHHVNLPEPDKLMKNYPFQLSGGMLQRVMIAFAACLRPAVIIADEPTTALDVNNQKKVLYYLEKIRATYGTAILLISHDLGVIAEMADDVMVMRNGRIIERGDVFQVFDNPQHAYTRELLDKRFVLHTETLPVGVVATS